MTPREFREFALACICHLLLILALRTLPTRRVLSFFPSWLPRVRTPISPERLAALVSRARRVCRGTCLTECLVMRWLAARNGQPDRPLTIGVARSAGGLRAHAWLCGRAGSGGFTPVWPSSSANAGEEPKPQ